jgi:hypothetical protein
MGLAEGRVIALSALRIDFREAHPDEPQNQILLVPGPPLPSLSYLSSLRSCHVPVFSFSISKVK